MGYDGLEGGFGEEVGGGGEWKGTKVKIKKRMGDKIIIYRDRVTLPEERKNNLGRK